MVAQVFHILRSRGKGPVVYRIVDLSGKVRATRTRLKNAREVVKCLDRGHEPPGESRQLVESLVRMKIVYHDGMARPWVVCTYADNFPIKHYGQRWMAVAWMRDYNDIRKAKMAAVEGSDDDKLIDMVVNRWLISDDSTSYGDLVEAATRALKAAKTG